MYRLTVLFAGVLLASVATGCRNEADIAVGSGPESKTTESGPAETPPKPFETIPLATDTSHRASPTTAGAAAGEVRKMTPLDIAFSWCPPGTFVMGSSEDAPGHQLNESQFQVTLTRGFWLQQTEVTQSQYEALMGVNPSFFKGDKNPVETVNWDEATEFCRRLSELPPEKAAGNRYRLPTEAEWEYAARAGSTSAFSFGDEEADLDKYGWYNANSQRMTHPVAEKQPNAWGLYDMHGNVLEWCSDWYGDYPAASTTDPLGPDSGTQRTLRGGGWFFVPFYARSSHRDAYVPTARYVGLGFRVVAEVSLGEKAEEQAAGPQSKQP